MPITTPSTYADELGDPEHFAHVLAHLFMPVLEEVGLTLIAPSALGAELIHAEIIRNLEQADYVLCDLSGLNPNVLFELGIRTSLDRPVILVKDNLTEQIPFDLNAINTLTYDGSLTPWSLADQKPRLVKHIKDVMSSSSTGNSMWRYFGLTKRAEPSEAGENPLEAKLDLLIREFSSLQLQAATADRDKEAIKRLRTRLVPKLMRHDEVFSFSLRQRGDNDALLILNVSSIDIFPDSLLDELRSEARSTGFDLEIEVRDRSNG